MGKNSAIVYCAIEQCWMNPQIIEERENKEKRETDRAGRTTKKSHDPRQESSIKEIVHCVQLTEGNRSAANEMRKDALFLFSFSLILLH